LAKKILDRALPINCIASTPTGAPPPTIDVPRVTSLHQNVPNPFNPTTKITFDLAREGHVKLSVYDVAGRLVKKLIDAKLPAKSGPQVTWNGLDERGAHVPSGVYFYRLETDDFTATRKLALLK